MHGLWLTRAIGRIVSAVGHINELAGVVPVHPEGDKLNKMTDVRPRPVEDDVLQDAEGRLHEVVCVVGQVAVAVCPLLTTGHQSLHIRLKLCFQV